MMCEHGGFDLCENCGSEGYLYVGNGPDERCDGKCPVCEGTGREWHDDEMGDDEESDDFRNAPWGEHSQFGVGA